jgi:hypothetical protein
MLLATLVLELDKSSWRERLVEDGHTPISKLECAVQQVQAGELRELLEELLQAARPPAVRSGASQA